MKAFLITPRQRPDLAQLYWAEDKGRAQRLAFLDLRELAFPDARGFPDVPMSIRRRPQYDDPRAREPEALRW